MKHLIDFRILLILALLLTSIPGRLLNDDETENNISQDSSSSEDEESPGEKLLHLLKHWRKSNSSPTDFTDENSYDRRSLFSTGNEANTLTPHTRQALIDILQQALDQGWRPNRKHYIPATRFGRHRR